MEESNFSKHLREESDNIFKIVVEVAPLFRLSYSQIYSIIYVLVKDYGFKLEEINREVLTDFILKYKYQVGG